MDCVSDLKKSNLLLFDRQTVLCGLSSKFVSEERKEKNNNICKVHVCRRAKAPTLFSKVLERELKKKRNKTKQKGERIDRVFRQQFSRGDLSISIVVITQRGKRKER